VFSFEIFEQVNDVIISNFAAICCVVLRFWKLL